MVDPVQIVHRDQERLDERQVGGEPVDRVQRREAGPLRRAISVWMRRQDRGRRRRGPGEQLLTPRGIGVRDDGLEQLPDRAEREPALELGAARAEDTQARGLGPLPDRREQGALAAARHALDHDQPAPARASYRQRTVQRFQLGLPFKKKVHAPKAKPSEGRGRS